ncbi:MAG TPA: NAD(P)-dependent alcohol dehydrogenase [Burkholderiaceae bacterium]|nr:NAD(P)-dependent alcohol dehydrogenase [Burkholderiaceae bacterium]
MRAWAIEDEWNIDHLRLTTRPEPRPGPGQVLLRMKAASLNYRDMYVIVRGYGSFTGNLPLVPVSDGVGEVVEVGAGVTRVRVGDRVCPSFCQTWIGGEPTLERLATSLGGPIDGTMVDFMCVPEEGVCKVPEHLSDEQAAGLPCAALTAWSAVVTHDRLSPGSRVLVQGTGGVALFALQFAKLLGAHVTVISSSDAKLARAKQLGADAGINYVSTPEWYKPARDISGGRGFDHVVELGGEKTLPQSLRCIRPGGTLSMIGVLSGGALAAPLGLVVTRQVRLQGITVGNRDTFEAMLRAIGQHKLQPVVDKVLAFEQLKEGLAHLKSGAQFGKICIRH